MKTIKQRIILRSTHYLPVAPHTNSFNPRDNILSAVPYLSPFYKRKMRLISGRFSHVTS